ncbi:hypothetical protein SAMN02910369_02874 [Lachnospiraceae bacterium NE2001]|nr:hypothetical protein SAMN02910369_02874 [Lachnospiraceae bacterium NE2001]
MNTEQKNKLKQLKTQMQEKKKTQALQNNILLQECLAALGTYEIIEDESVIEELVSFASKPDAEKHSPSDIAPLIDDAQYYIVWDEATLPVVMCSGNSIKNCWDDVLAVAFETYLVDASTKDVIGI